MTTANTTSSTAAAAASTTASSTDVESLWPAQYYASYDTTAAQPTPVTGWYDVWGMGSTADVPAAADMIALTADQWAARLPIGQGVQSDAIVSYTAPSTLTLAEQASSAYSSGVATMWSEYGALNEETPSDWVTYLKALKAIANGTDTTSTTLPAAPTS